MIITPLVKLLVSFRNMFNCCKNKKNGEYSVSYSGEGNGTVRGISKFTQTDPTLTPPPRYSLPPVLMSTNDVKWDTSNVNCDPTIALPDSIVSAESVANMDSVYDSLSNLDEEPVPDHNSKNKVTFVKSGRLSEVLQGFQSEATKRAEASGTKPDESGN